MAASPSSCKRVRGARQAAALGGSFLSLLACTRAELPLEGPSETDGAGNEAGTGESTGGLGGETGSTGKGGGGKAGGGAVAAGSGGTGSDGGGGVAASASAGNFGAALTGGTGAGTASGGTSSDPPESEGGSSSLSCNPGQYIAEVIDVVPVEMCVDCPEGSFSTKKNAETCAQCRLCGSLERTAECTSTQNTRCASMGFVAEFGSPGTYTPAGVTVDPAGSIWVTGYVVPPEGNQYGGFGFVRKFGNEGSPSLVDELHSGEDLRPRGIAADADGNVYVVGFFSGTFGDSGGYRYDVFVRKYPSDGSAPTTEVFGSEVDDQAEGITVDSAGNVWVAGITNGDFGGENLGSYDLFVRRYRNGSDPVTLHFGTDSIDWFGGIAADDAGNVWVTASVDVHGVEDPAVNFNVGLWKIGPDVTVVSRTGFGGEANETPAGIAVDDAGNLWIVGYSSVTNFDRWEAFSYEIPADGSEPVSEQLSDGDLEQISAVTVDRAGNVWMVGSSLCNVAGTPLDEVTTIGIDDPIAGEYEPIEEYCAPLQPGMGYDDAFIREYPANGSAVLTHQFGSTGGDSATAVTPGLGRDIWIAGSGYLGEPEHPGDSAYVLQFTP